MYKDSLKNFLLAKTSHRIPKVVTLLISSSVLVAMVNIDASASAFGGRDSNSVRSNVVLSLASESMNNQFSGLVKRWKPIAPVPPSNTPTTNGTNRGNGSGNGTGGSSTSSITQPPTTTTAPTTTTTITSAPPVATVAPTTTTTTPFAQSTPYPLGTLDSSEPSGYAPPAANAISGYSMNYETDFTGTTLPAAWGLYSGQPGGDPGALFSPSHVTVGNGLLQINTFQDSADNNEWVTGGTCLCSTLPQETYGAYFVRSRMTGPGTTGVELLWPDQAVWPPEVDFSETSGSVNDTGAIVHYITSSSPNAQIGHELTIDMTQWHTWGVIWTPTSLTYTVDGQVWATVTTAAAIPDIPMFLSLQSQTWCSSGGACPTSPQSMLVDWVATYSPNS